MCMYYMYTRTPLLSDAFDAYGRYGKASDLLPFQTLVESLFSLLSTFRGRAEDDSPARAKEHLHTWNTTQNESKRSMLLLATVHHLEIAWPQREETREPRH